ncbi:hypothetical protein [Deinococcus hopiensis]|uniref:hypothetical protein n=1 Tax=Deinococcus hopiensis TaxID=309885 RepID=UPI00111C41EA|nr:hypothetical protein [Deinococcus hopiensis]
MLPEARSREKVRSCAASVAHPPNASTAACRSPSEASTHHLQATGKAQLAPQAGAAGKIGVSTPRHLVLGYDIDPGQAHVPQSPGEMIGHPVVHARVRPPDQGALPEVRHLGWGVGVSWTLRWLWPNGKSRPPGFGAATTPNAAVSSRAAYTSPCPKDSLSSLARVRWAPPSSATFVSTPFTPAKGAASAIPAEGARLPESRYQRADFFLTETGERNARGGEWGAP